MSDVFKVGTQVVVDSSAVVPTQFPTYSQLSNCCSLHCIRLFYTQEMQQTECTLTTYYSELNSNPISELSLFY